MADYEGYFGADSMDNYDDYIEAIEYDINHPREYDDLTDDSTVSLADIFPESNWLQQQRDAILSLSPERLAEIEASIEAQLKEDPDCIPF